MHWRKDVNAEAFLGKKAMFSGHAPFDVLDVAEIVARSSLRKYLLFYLYDDCVDLPLDRRALSFDSAEP